MEVHVSLVGRKDPTREVYRQLRGTNAFFRHDEYDQPAGDEFRLAVGCVTVRPSPPPGGAGTGALMNAEFLRDAAATAAISSPPAGSAGRRTNRPKHGEGR